MNPNDARAPAAAPRAAVPWWRVGPMWLVVGGPAVVIVAGFATLALAIASPDPVIDTTSARLAAEQPAVQARNHAATPVAEPER